VAEAEPKTVLIVDDDEIKRYTVSRVLEKAGIAVSEAATGTEALEAVRASPDLVILDINLPDMDGFEVCRRIKGDPATASVLVLHHSATAVEIADKVFGLEGGADGYLAEPVGTSELLATVRAMLRIGAAERAARALSLQWQATFDAISDGVCLLDDRDRVIRCNAAMASFASRPASELVGLGCDVLSGGRLDEVELCRVARASRERRTAEYSRDGRWYRVVADPVLGEAGEVAGSVYIVADVTEAKERERERADLLGRERDARAQAETANRAKDEFLATISHELRTPLNSMLGWLSLLRSGQLDDAAAARAVDTLERNARSQAQLISDILDVSRIVTGKVRLDVQSVDLATVVASALDSVRPGAEAKSVRVSSVLDPNAGPVSGDPERLQQVVWNLLSNAIKFTPKHGRVQVELKKVDSHAQVVVADTGVGISAEFLPHVFERFRQADSSTTRVHAGLGLGLAIVRHLVELHGGTVSAASEGVGRGATFTVALPIAPVVSARPREASDVHEGGSAVDALAPLDGLRVLVVDDDADTRAMLDAVFRQSGAIVRLSPSASDALETLSSWLPDVLVSDIGMPENDGNSLIRRVRALPPERGGRTPAVALTAYARTEDRLRALASGFQMFLPKPAEPAEVTAVVASLVGRPRG
jgi:PAS domain S-box-containing protein